MTLDEFVEIEARLHSNPREVKSHVLEDIRADRLSEGLQNLSSSTFYRAMKETDLLQFLSEAEYAWFTVRGRKIPNDYAVSNERNTLSSLFTFSNLKAYGGADLQELFNRLITAKRHSEKYGIKSVGFYPRILTRGGHLRSLLSSIPPYQQEEIQARTVNLRDAFGVCRCVRRPIWNGGYPSKRKNPAIDECIQTERRKPDKKRGIGIDKDKRAMIKKPDSIRAIDHGNEDVARILSIERVIEYIKQGKIPITSSYKFQDLGKRIKEVKPCAGFLTDKIVEQLIHGEFLVNFWWLFEAMNCSKMEEEDEDSFPPSWNNLSAVLHFVSNYVRENTPGWFAEHVNLFREQTDGMFSIEYSEEEFAERLYVAIGFLGGHFSCMERLTGTTVEGVVIDTRGI